jgi:ribosomal protein S18 acetylase RimI-like enzyme
MLNRPYPAPLVNPGNRVATRPPAAFRPTPPVLGNSATPVRAPLPTTRPMPPDRFRIAQRVAAAPVRPAGYAVQAPVRMGSGWQIRVTQPGMPQPVGSVEMHATGHGIHISDLHVSQEHRRRGVAAKLIDAAVQSARSQGFAIARLEARPNSPLDISSEALVSMYQRHGFRTVGKSARGNPLMERRT